MNGVLLFHNILWAHYKARVFSELSKLCAGRGIQFFVVQYALTETRRGPVQIERELHAYPHKLLFEGAYEELTFFEKVRHCIRELRENDPEIVVLPGYWDPSYWILLAAARLQGRKTIVSFDSTEGDRPRHWAVELLKKLFIANCDGGFAYGQRASKYLEKLGMARHKITIRCQAAANDDIRAVFDRERPARDMLVKELGLAPRNFCYVGRLSAEKNLSCLFHAYGLLTKDNPKSKDWGLLVVGDGPERARLADLSKREGLDRVKYVGGVSWQEVPRYLAACDVLVLPSTSEPWGLVVNEAMVCGLPVLVSNRCGCVDDLVLNSKTGFSFDPKDPNELRDRMDYFVRTPEEITRIGDQGHVLIKGFSPAAAASQMMNGIQRLKAPHAVTGL